MWPFEYGGPSCRTNGGAPARAARVRAYSFDSIQRSMNAGSRWARSAFIGKRVSGSMTVSAYLPLVLPSGFASFGSFPDMRAALYTGGHATLPRMSQPEAPRPRASWDEYF